jgi:PAS domain S-box-containing protein
MKTAIRIPLAAGALLAGLSLTYLALAEVPWNLPPLTLGVLLGALLVGCSAGLVALWRGPVTAALAPAQPQRLHVTALNGHHAHSNGRTAKDRMVLLARLTPQYRWQKTARALRRLLGRRAEELHGRPIFTLLHPEDIHCVDETLHAAQVSGRVHSVRCRFLTKEQTAALRPGSEADTALLPPLDPGSFVYLLLRIRPQRDEQSQLLGFTCLFSDDASALRRREAALQRLTKLRERDRRRLATVRLDLERLKESYRDLYHNSPVMYFSLDVKGRLVTFNDTLIRTLGQQREELMHRRYAALLDPVLRKNAAELARHTPSREGEFETRWRRTDGTLLDVWVRTVPVLDERGGPVRYRSAALDLTEKNRLGQELRARGDELERTNARLRQTNSELEDFTYVVSHDLKEPLRTLQAYSHILAEEYSNQLGADGFQYINHMVRASRRLGLLIDELLKLSQVGHSTRPPRLFNLIEAVATVRQDLVDLIQRKEATVLTEGSLPDVVGDPHRIVQLLANLVANGLKYNQSPAPKVVIGSSPASDARHVVVYVRDNGIGIDPAHHAQIFGIFRRLHQADQYEGAGAGLAICKKIVEAQGGKIWVESRAGEGATFYFTLPRAPEGMTRTASAPLAESSRRTVAAAEAPTAVTPPAEEPRLLLVEDMDEVGIIIRKLGQKSGLHITWFKSAEEAWDYLQRHRPDFMLFDINLPGMNGVELCRRVRTLPGLGQTPVALFSQDQDPARLAALREAGATFFLSKDLLCQPATWQDKLRELLERSRGSETTRPAAGKPTG